jgi:hypothetical protein
MTAGVYNEVMKIQATYGPARSKRTQVSAVIAAIMVLGMLLSQLFSYEDFAAVLGGVLPFNDQPLATVGAAVIVIVELLSLPYLLGMYVSILMRIFSAGLAFVVSGFWLLTSLTNAHAANSALFSTTLELSGGLLAALWSAALFGIVTYVIFTDTRFRHDTSS